MIPPAPIFFLPTLVSIPPALDTIPPALVYIPSAPVYIPFVPVYIQPVPVYIPSAPIYILSAPVYIPPVPIYIPSTPVLIFQSTSRLRLCLPHKRPRPATIRLRTRIHRLRPWLSVRARRRTVRALDHLVRAGINAFAPEGSRKTTATCARGPISSRPFSVHSVQSPCT
jgi:hypothetical protein